MRAAFLLGAVLLAAGCALGQPGERYGNGPLLPSLQASAVGDTVFFVFQVTNTSTEPVELHFRSGQTYDFAVMDGDRTVWRWSDDQMFTQALRQEVLAPGATLRFEESWRPPAGLQQPYVAVGRLVAENRPVEQRMNIRLP
ncbi:hypothetical protein BH23GEM6_BH23GEM6_20430 [soil metagenome]